MAFACGLAACGAHERGSPAEGERVDASESAQTTEDAGSVADAAPVLSAPDSALGVNAPSPPCGASQLTENGGLPVACPDAGGLDSGTDTLSDASSTPSDASSTPSDASSTLDVTTPPEAGLDAAPEASAPDAGQFGPCAELKHDCDLSYFAVQLPATCSLGKTFGADSLTVRYQACEVCNKSGTLNQYHVTVKDCDGCEQVYSEGTTANYRISGKGCRDLAWTSVSLGNTQANRSCIDVYAAVGSSTNGSVTDGLHSIRVCRCNRQTGNCVRCSSTDCDAM